MFAKEYMQNRESLLAQQRLIQTAPALLARENEIDRDWEMGMAQAVRMRATEVRDPEVVSVETGLFVVGIRMITENHADARIDDLGGDAIAILVRHPCFRIPSAAMQVRKLGELGRGGKLLRGYSRGRDQTHRDGLLHPFDDVGIAALLLPYDTGRDILVFLVDTRRVGVRRLHDMRVRRDDRFGNHVIGHKLRLLLCGR